MLFLNDADGGGEGEVVTDEEGFGIADAEGAAAGEPLEEGWSYIVEPEFGVAGERRAEERGGKEVRGVEFHAGAEEREFCRGEGEAHGIGAGAAAGEDRGWFGG